MRLMRFFLIALAAVALIGCDGDGGSSGDSPKEKCDRLVEEMCALSDECSFHTSQSACMQEVARTDSFDCDKIVSVKAEYELCMVRIEQTTSCPASEGDLLPDDCKGVLISQ